MITQHYSTAITGRLLPQVFLYAIKVRYFTKIWTQYVVVVFWRMSRFNKDALKCQRILKES